MIIANPIYDTVFKYLMEDLDIAKDILSLILNTEIISLSVKPQETASETVARDSTPINIYRLDFVGVFQEPDGTTKKALIELQKTKRSTNITRFRKYLGENYQKEDKITENGKEISQSLEIITIYLLGFELEDVPVAVLKVKNCFVDVITGNTLVTEPKDKFIRLLNHESYTIQIPKLQPNEQNRIEHTLNVFNQRYVTDDIHTLDYEGSTEDPLMAKIINRLIRAIANEELRRKMNMEDEIETEFQAYDSKIENFQKMLTEKDKALTEKEKVIFERDKALSEKDAEIEALKRLLLSKS
jgi:hypothetical protein